MKKIVKYFIIFAALTFVGITNVFAAEHVSSVQDMVTALGTEDDVEIIVDQDINLGGSLTIDRDYATTIDLNNHTLSNSSSVFYVNGTGDVTFKDGKIAITQSSGNSTVSISGTGDITFDNVEVIATNGTTIMYTPSAGNLYLTNNTIVRTTSNSNEALHIQNPQNGNTVYDSTAKIYINGATLVGSPGRGAICGPASTTITIALNKGVLFTNTKESGALYTLFKTLKPSTTYNKLYINGVDTTLTTEQNINGVIAQFGQESDFKSVTKNTMTNGTIAVNNSTSATVQALVGYPTLLVPMPDQYYKLESVSAKDASNNDITIQSNMFTMRNSNVTISATFAAEDYHNVNVANVANGTLTLSKDQARNGERVDITANPASG